MHRSGSLRRTRRFALRAALRGSIIPALALLPVAIAAQDSPALPRGWSGFYAMGASSVPGPTALGSAAPAGSLGLAYERPFAERLTWRAELGFGGLMADGGPAPSEFSDVSTLQLTRSHLGVSVRRYSDRRAWIAGGVNAAFQQECWVDVTGGIGVTGTYSIDCPDFTDRDYESAPVAANLTLGAGLDRGRFGFALRVEQGVTPTVHVNGTGQRARLLAAELQYRFGHEARGTPPPPRGARATAPLPGQMAAGTVGWALGAVAGLVIGDMMAASENDWGAPLLGAFVGAPLGTTFAIHAFGRSKGLRSNAVVTFGGAVAGMFGGPAMWATSPLGAAVAYNALSREREASRASCATRPAGGCS
ncbi:MAG: hypothetical protein KA761_06265 [Gemmatimonadaceae bacterium]|nr:hypothetical protein [Gemmatimonadaceae bacterium]